MCLYCLLVGRLIGGRVEYVSSLGTVAHESRQAVWIYFCAKACHIVCIGSYGRTQQRKSCGRQLTAMLSSLKGCPISGILPPIVSSQVAEPNLDSGHLNLLLQ